jgi:uncharacterized protein (TIGR02246 family)
VTALLIALVLATSAAPPDPQADVKRNVTGTLEAQAKAWNRGDLKEFCAIYVDDAVFVSPNGITRGRQAVFDRYQKKYPDKKAMGTLGFVFVDVRVEGSSASVIALWKLSYPDKPEAAGHTLLTLREKGGKWFIVHDASM